MTEVLATMCRFDRSARRVMLRAALPLLLVVTGCGAPAMKQPASAAPAAHPLPQVEASSAGQPAGDGATPRESLSSDARDVRITLELADGSRADIRAAAERVRIGLVRSGYTLVDAGAEHDAELRVDLEGDAADSGASEPGRLSLQLKRAGAVVQWLVTPLASRASRVDEVRELVDRLTTSPGLAELAKSAAGHAAERRGARYAANAPSAVAADAPTDESGFSQVAARRCRNDGNRAACARLADYVAANPNGRHVATAKAVLEIRNARPR